MSDGRFEEFTRDRYRAHVRQIKSQYPCRFYHDFDPKERFVLLRHDIDMSVHAALALARIEAEEGVQSTYFLLPGSIYYNLLDPYVQRVTEEICSLGHALGLHFDARNYPVDTVAALEKHLHAERRFLEEYCNLSIKAFSFHNPATLTDEFREHSYAGMVNTYAEYFRTQLEYVSDSNGIWRHRSLTEVLASDPPRLHVLTHPIWWSDTALSPRARLLRCVDGRGRAVLDIYNNELAEYGRRNVCGLEDEFEVLTQLLGEPVYWMEMAWLRGEHAMVLITLWRIIEAQGLEKDDDTFREWRKRRDLLVKGQELPVALVEEGVVYAVQQLKELTLRHA